MRSNYCRAILKAFFGMTDDQLDTELARLTEGDINELLRLAEQELVPFD